MGSGWRPWVAAAAAVLSVALVIGAASADPIGAITESSAGLNNGASPYRIVSGSDGNLWFDDQGSPKAIGRVTTAGAVNEYNLASGNPVGIADGADGNLWVAVQTPPAIVQVTPSGSMMSFPVPGAPGSMTLGPDGNVWFTDVGSKAIGRITPTGSVKEFSAGLNSGSAPNRIAAGPDGNLWFTDAGTTAAIGKITPGGTINEYSAGLKAGSHPDRIAPGTDGDVWFTDTGTTKAIGRVTPTGSIAETTTGLNPGADPHAIEPGPDGNVWFTDDGTTEAIGKITPGGKITEFSSALKAGADLQSIATGPDGNLWFVDNGTNEIGRIGAGVQAASIAPPAITGGGMQGAAQTCAGDRWATWDGQQPSPSLYGFDGYSWLLDGSAISGATGQTYTPVAADVGRKLTCAVTVTYPLVQTTAVATSAAVSVASNGNGGGSGPATTGSKPVVTGVSPGAGPATGGTTVTLTGSGFTGATGVLFGTAAGTVTSVVSDMQLIAVSPAYTAIGHVHVRVVTPKGTSGTATANYFAYTAPLPGQSAPTPKPTTLTGKAPVGRIVYSTVLGTGATRVLNVRLRVNESASARLVLSFRGGRQASKTFAVKGGTNNLKLPVPHATKGVASLSVTITAGHRTKQYTASVLVPA